MKIGMDPPWIALSSSTTRTCFYRDSIFVCNSLGHGLVGWSEALLSIHYSRFIKSSIYSIVASQEWLFVFWLNQSIGWRSCCSDWTLSAEHWGWSPAEALIYSKSIWYDLQRAFLLLLLRPRLIALQESGGLAFQRQFSSPHSHHNPATNNNTTNNFSNVDRITSHTQHNRITSHLLFSHLKKVLCNRDPTKSTKRLLSSDHSIYSGLQLSFCAADNWHCSPRNQSSALTPPPQEMRLIHGQFSSLRSPSRDKNSWKERQGCCCRRSQSSSSYHQFSIG